MVSKSIKKLEKKLLKEFSSICNKREIDILKRRYGLGEYHPTILDDIAKHYGISRERVRQIEGKAVRKYNHYGFGTLKEYIAELTRR